MVCKNLEFDVCGSLLFSQFWFLKMMYRMNFPGNAAWLDTEWYCLCSDRFSW